MDCTVHGVAKSQTRLSDFHFMSLSIMCSRIIHSVAHYRMSFFLKTEWCSIVSTHHTWTIHLSMGLLYYLHNLAPLCFLCLSVLWWSTSSLISDQLPMLCPLLRTLPLAIYTTTFNSELPPMLQDSAYRLLALRNASLMWTESLEMSGTCLGKESKEGNSIPGAACAKS